MKNYWKIWKIASVFIIILIFSFVFRWAQANEYTKKAVDCNDRFWTGSSQEEECFKNVCKSWEGEFDGVYSWLYPKVTCLKNDTFADYKITIADGFVCHTVIETREAIRRCMGWTIWLD